VIKCVRCGGYTALRDFCFYCGAPPFFDDFSPADEVRALDQIQQSFNPEMPRFRAMRLMHKTLIEGSSLYLSKPDIYDKRWWAVPRTCGDEPRIRIRSAGYGICSPHVRG